MQIRRADAATVRPVRWAVLRPEAPDAESIVFGGDDADAAGHFGAFDGDDLVGVISVFAQPHPDRPQPGDWRIRGMAVVDGRRSSGIGGLLLDAVVDHVRTHGGVRIWCNARTPAVRFYQQRGFTSEGDEFLTAGDRPHYRMSRQL